MGIEHHELPAARHLPGSSKCAAATEEEKGNKMSVQTVSSTPVKYHLMKQRKKAYLNDITQFDQYCRANFRGALQEYFQKFHPNEVLRFRSMKLGTESEFISNCKAHKITGAGRARTKKQAIQLAALDVIVKMGLVPAEGSTRRCASNALEVVPNTISPMSENDQYKRDNFRGALLEYFQKLGREVSIVFETTPQFPGRFISTCRLDGNVCTGTAGSKKRSIQLAAFDLICKLKLLSIEEIERQRERQKNQHEVRSLVTKKPFNNQASQTIESILLSEQCNNTDYLRVLELYFQKLGREVTIKIDTIAKTNKSFISTCSIDGVEGTGIAKGKKEAIQLAAIDLIVKLKVPHYEKIRRLYECQGENRKWRRVWKSSGLLYILPSAKAKQISDHFSVKEQTDTGYRCLLPVPLSILLARGHERCKPFRCTPDLCKIRAWMVENVPKDIMLEYQINKISGGFPCKFFTKLKEKELLAQLNAVKSTHSALCGLETHRNCSRSRLGSRIVNMSFTGWGKREEQDKDSLETARRETLEECGIDIEKVSWSVKLRRISFGEPLYIFIDMDRDS